MRSSFRSTSQPGIALGVQKMITNANGSCGVRSPGRATASSGNNRLAYAAAQLVVVRWMETPMRQRWEGGHTTPPGPRAPPARVTLPTVPPLLHPPPGSALPQLSRASSPAHSSGIPFFCSSVDRMRSFLPVLSFLVLELAQHVRALSLDVQVRQRANTLARRDNGQHTVPVTNTRNSEYIANITLGGRQIPVLLDTGRYTFLSHSS